MTELKLPESFSVTIYFHSDWHIGSGSGVPGGVDRVVQRDIDGLPYVPGKTLVGIWRDAAEQLAFGLDDGKLGNWQRVHQYLFGDQPNLAKQPNQASPQPAVIEVTPAHFPEEIRRVVRNQPHLKTAFTMVRPGVAIDSSNGRAKPECLRFVEVARGGVSVSFRCNLPADAPPVARALLLAATKLIERLGGKRRRGLGKCEWRVEQTLFTQALQLLQEPIAWQPPQPHFDMDVPTTNAQGGWQTIRVELTLQNPIALNQTRLGNVETTLDYIPGTVLLADFARAILGRKFNQAIPRGLFRVLNAYRQIQTTVAENSAERGRPYPLSLFCKKDCDVNEPENLVNRLCDKPPTEESYKQARERYIGHGIGDYWPHSQKVEILSRTHNTVEDLAQRPLEKVGGVFTYEAIAPKDSDGNGVTFVAEVRIAAALSPENVEGKLRKLTTIRIGRSRKDDYGAVKVTIKPAPARSNLTDMVANQKLYVWLLSDVLLRDVRLRFQPSAENFRRVLAEKLGLADCDLVLAQGDNLSSVVRVRRFDSWNVNWTLPRPTLPTLQAGSCFVFETRKPLRAAKLQEVQDAGIGERRAEGYGELCFNDPLLTKQPAGIVQPKSTSSKVPSRLIRQEFKDAFAIARRVEEQQAREIIRRAAILFASKPENRKDKLGWEISSKDGHLQSNPTMSQLGLLRTVVQKLNQDTKLNTLKTWVDQPEKHDARSKKWGQSLNTLKRLANNRQVVWDWLDIRQWTLLTADGLNEIQKQLWAYAVQALLFASMQAQKRELEPREGSQS